MARMLNAHAARWQTETRTYGHDVKANLRAREKRAWHREWDEDIFDAECERWELGWAQLAWRRICAALDARPS